MKGVVLGVNVEEVEVEGVEGDYLTWGLKRAITLGLALFIVVVVVVVIVVVELIIKAHNKLSLSHSDYSLTKINNYLRPSV